MTAPSPLLITAVALVAVLFFWRCAASIRTRRAVMQAASPAVPDPRRTAPDVRPPQPSAGTCCAPTQHVLAEYHDGQGGR